MIARMPLPAVMMTVAMKLQGPCFNNERAIWKKFNKTAQ
jgi:hypothetical protein